MLIQFMVGVTGALLGVIGWLLVGLYIQKRAHDRQARDAGRAVYFELAGNRLTIFVAQQYSSYGTLSRSAFDRLLPELATWLPASELQALVMAYLGHGGYEQAASDEDVPKEVRAVALGGLLETHETALKLLRDRVFSAKEAATLYDYVSPEYHHMIETADASAKEMHR